MGEPDSREAFLRYLGQTVKHLTQTLSFLDNIYICCYKTMAYHSS